MITKDQNIALLKVGNAALKKDEWVEYAYYCLEREKGLRKEAFKHLDNFLKSTADWAEEQKIDFIKFLFQYFESVRDADYGPFPQPLSDKVIKPTLELWCENEKNDSKPFRWYGKYYRSESHILKALEINSLDDKARQVLLNWWTYEIYYSVHHLPEGYIGNPNDDLELANKIKEQINGLTEPKLRDHWINELEEDLELVKNYIQWKESGHPNLEIWGKENNKRVSYGLTRIYYNEK